MSHVGAAVPPALTAPHPHPRHLDLAHGRSTAATAHVDASAALLPREEGSSTKAGETKPEEGGGSLRLTAALLGVSRTVGDGVAVRIALTRVLASKGPGLAGQVRTELLQL